MIDAGILDGDLLVVDRAVMPVNGGNLRNNVAHGLLDDDAFLK